MPTNTDKMNEIFGGLDKNLIVSILVHGYPDPDALGSAAGFAVLLKDIYGLSSKIFHFGAITHPQNKSLKNILHISLEDIKNFNAETTAAVVILDTDLSNTGLKGKLDRVDVRIDHHDMDRDIEPKLSDVRIIGATCSIVWEYLSAFKVNMSKHTEVATALALGIMTDTADFTSDNTIDADIDAFRMILPFADKTAMSRINKYPLPKYYFETEAKAFKDSKQMNTTMVSYIGDVSQHRDIIATIADRFLRIDGVDTVMILGLVDNNIVASIHTEDSRVEMNEIIARVFGKENGGGKGYSGGATFPLGKGFELLTDKKIRDSAVSEVINTLKQNLFSAVGEKADVDEPK